MEPDSLAGQQVLLKSLRRRRAELRESINALEHALAAPAAGEPELWAERVRAQLNQLAADFREHLEITEGPEGLYRDLLGTAPRLSGEVVRLTEEHGEIKKMLDDLLTFAGTPEVGEDLDRTRDLGTRLLGRLVRHRQRGSDLVYEAYEVDIGGDT